MLSVLIENRACIGVSGPDAEHFLHNLVTADIEGLPVDEWRPSALLTAQGKVQFAFLVARTDTGFLLDCDGRDAADLHKRLKFYRLRAKVDLTEHVLGSSDIAWDVEAPVGAIRDSRFGSVSVWRSNVVPSAPIGVANWDALRIHSGIAEPHTDYTYGDVFPHDINLDQINGVSFKKGCYVGQEVVSPKSDPRSQWQPQRSYGPGDDARSRHLGISPHFDMEAFVERTQTLGLP